jgi:outer membrane protein assembly factor BamB
VTGGQRRRLLPRSTRGRLTLTGAVVLVLAGVALAGYLYERHRTGNVYHPHAVFVPQTVAPKLPAKGPSRFAWPLYGYTPNHTRFFPASAQLRPPFRTVWTREGSALLEFPPVMYGNRIFQLGDDAVIHAIDKYTGLVLWSRPLGALSASSPAVSSNTVYATVLSRSPGSQSGRVVAMNSVNGHIRWSRDLSSRCESSPLLADGKLFFGTENGTVYALNARTGAIVWTYHAAGAVKASPTLSNGVLYFGDYAGDLQAVRESDGHRMWVSGSGGALLGSGQFYSTAAVVYGRVFLGNTDGRIYAYDAATGKLDWAVQTGAYVYSSPAVANAPGLGPTIYMGSYDGTFRALNARSGHIDWEYNADGRISGSATIVGRIVYFADLGTHHTYGLGISTGKVVFSMDGGSFDPVITDDHYIYLTGTTGLYALVPFTPAEAKSVAAARAKGAAAARAKARRTPTRTGARRTTHARARAATGTTIIVRTHRRAPARVPAKSSPRHARHRASSH